jgi:putative Mn2+ efflux pump MntP
MDKIIATLMLIALGVMIYKNFFENIKSTKKT